MPPQEKAKSVLERFFNSVPLMTQNFGERNPVELKYTQIAWEGERRRKGKGLRVGEKRDDQAGEDLLGD